MAVKRLTRLEIERLRLIKYKCEHSFMFFCMYMFKENNNVKFLPYKHLLMIAERLESVARGETKRLIINIFPRSGKTEMAVKLFIAWGLALNQRAKFIHLSYSGDLALDNSAQAKEYINSPAFQDIWKMDLRIDSKAKQKWFNKKGGGCYATSTNGQITGFGAGDTVRRVETENPFSGFSGAIIIDDPNKPSEAFSDTERNKVNARYNNTIRSRVNDPRNTPIIVIQQRVHEDDLSGFLLNGGSGEEWEHLNLPALDENNVPLCPEKFTFEELETLRQADRYTFAGQYMQQPTPDEGGVWLKEWFNKIPKAELPNIPSWDLYIDGAYTKDNANDPSGLMIAAKHNGNLYILSAIDKYMELPDLVKFIPQYIHSVGVSIGAVLIEPKASGKSIAQILRNETDLNVIEIKGTILRESKMERAKKSALYIEGGRVFLVDGNWNSNYLQQVGTFPNGKHDEHVDLTCYAIDRNLIKSSGVRIIW